MIPRGQDKGTGVNATSLPRGVTSYNGAIGPVVFDTLSDIPPSSIQYNQLQNETAHTLLGNPTAGSTSPAEITLGATLSFSGSALQTGAITGDVAASVNSFVTTLATVNTGTGSFGSSTSIPSFTVNGKGLITGTGSNAVIAPAGTLTGDTLAANVHTSSLTVLGTITAGVWNGTALLAAALPSNINYIVGNDRKTGLTASQALATYTVGGADASFMVSANILVTTSTLHSFTATVSYTSEDNTSRVVTLNFSTLAGAITPTIANAGGAVPYEGVPLHIRCKAATTIIIATTGAFTTVTYNFEERIQAL